MSTQPLLAATNALNCFICLEDINTLPAQPLACLHSNRMHRICIITKRGYSDLSATEVQCPRCTHVTRLDSQGNVGPNQEIFEKTPTESVSSRNENRFRKTALSIIAHLKDAGISSRDALISLTRALEKEPVLNSGKESHFFDLYGM